MALPLQLCLAAEAQSFHCSKRCDILCMLHISS